MRLLGVVGIKILRQADLGGRANILLCIRDICRFDALRVILTFEIKKSANFPAVEARKHMGYLQ